MGAVEILPEEEGWVDFAGFCNEDLEDRFRDGRDCGFLLFCAVYQPENVSGVHIKSWYGIWEGPGEG